ncbi:GIY-YIG nuclease family protein [Candidatus Uabimicrobium amorphum]|uniref:Methionine sulfoxide reductase n=1 Tax=Uabimicrobium amorphum TaxID=2596890 RepID=A0A5S9ISC6_UABAM|nr:GIY-YIG nuclease family protein [Candidatus Uabimicrobium amorphum]BBM86650.1 methionine sulfoxide reductase [Candidatus Uabimicrobium amorphum]
MHPITIKLFLAQGHADGLRIAEISNWSGKAIACPRNEFNTLLKRDEVEKPGIYLLFGDQEDSNPTVYIGEAEDIGRRLKKHETLDWTQVITFISKDDNLTKSHIKYLEGKLIDKFREVDAVSVHNAQTSGAKLPESEIAYMNAFLECVYQILPILGVYYFSTKQSKAKSSVLYCKIKQLEAKGRRTNSGFIVLKGSQAVFKLRPSVSNAIKNRRQMLLDKKILIEENDYLIFTRDHDFSSPSTAGAIVRGGNTNGLIQWKDKDGQTLKEIESQENGNE